MLIQWNFGRGFLQYVNERDHARVVELAGEIAQRYEARGNWDWINHRQWQRLTGPGGPEGRKPKRQDRPPRGRRRGPGPSSVDLGPRLTLYNADSVKLIGRSVNLNSDRVVRHPINFNGVPVGWLAYKPLRKVRSSRDLDFLAQQSRSFLLTSALVLLAAGIAGYFFARHLTQPLTRLNRFVRQLADGNYDKQIPVSGRDEIAGLSRDVNALARTLKENLSARQRWVADISHELRTPLAIVQGEVEALRDGVRTVTPESLDSLHVEVLRLGKLIDDLHQLSLSDAGALNYRFENVDITTLVSEAIHKFGPHAQQAGLRLSEVTAPTSPLTINADPLRLRQLLDNLLENSLRYTDTGGAIEVRLTSHPQQVVLEIADTAPSVNQQDCEKLFERLYRVDSSRARELGGSGLGLAIARNIVQAHQGTINAKPSDMGGLSITVELPH